MMIIEEGGRPVGEWTDRRPGEYVEGSTRAMSHERVDKTLRQRQVLDILYRPMTAKEVAVAMFATGLTPNAERNNAAPRLTELRDKGLVEVIGKKRCSYTGKIVAVYRRTD